MLTTTFFWLQQFLFFIENMCYIKSETRIILTNELKIQKQKCQQHLNTKDSTSLPFGSSACLVVAINRNVFSACNDASLEPCPLEPLCRRSPVLEPIRW